MEGTTWRKSYQGKASLQGKGILQENGILQEGFNLPGDDYFINVKRTLSIKSNFGGLLEKIKKLLKKIPNPITKMDEGMEAFLKTLLMLMMGQVDCKTGKLDTKLSDAEESTFTWSSGQLDLLKNNSVSVGNDIQSGWKDNIEHFSMPDTPDLIYTIQSFLKNHSQLNQTAVTTYYLKKLNAYEKSLGKPPTSDQLFVFNNEFDNILEDASIVSEIKKISNSIPEPSYPNTDDGFADYLKNTARFSFSSDTPITFYFFATQYFPYPKDLQGFEQAIQNVDDPSYIMNLAPYLSSLTKPADPPPTPVTPTDIDTNYAFSIDLNRSRTETIQTYLKYISEWYGLLLYYKYKKSLAILFPTIEANVCMVYLTYLNAVEYTKYRVYSTFLTPYELAMFNHLFFICLMQDQITFVLKRNLNIYNLASPPDGIPKGSISKGIPTVYINLLPQNIFSLVGMFAMEINNRVRYLSGSITDDTYQPLPLDGTLILPPVPNDVIPPINILIANYILGLFTSTPFNGTSIPDNVIPANEITDYYYPAGMSECEQENNRMQKECEDYAKKIKGEIYRMICVPIMVYIAYNFYYMFFFKDCFDLSKKTDEAGNVIYERKCMECFTPIFPDWELMYREFEQRQTDFFFEFVFKPVKMFYTILNAIKAFFRKGIPGGYVIKDNIPYVFFLFTFVPVYRFMTNHADIILNTLKTLSKLKLPDIQIMGNDVIDGYAKGITVFFFLFSFLNKFFGISISEIMECIYNAYLARKIAREAAAAADKQLASPSGETKPGFLGRMKNRVGSFFGKKKEETPSVPSVDSPLKGGVGAAKPAAGAGAPDTSKSLMGNCKLQGPSYENSWVKWIMKTGDGAFTKLIKIVCAIIYWILKFAVSMSMVKFAKLIFTLYFFVNAVMGISNYTTSLQSSSYKLDIIHRIFYTKLCSSHWRTEPFKYFAKCFFFVFIYFLVEMVILHNLMKGINNYSSMSSNKTAINTGLSAKTNDDTDKNSMAVKTFMMVLNGLLVIFVLLWCVYKAVYKMPNFVRAYEEQDDPSTDKRFEYDCSKEVDAYEERSKNLVLKTMMKSDEFNKAFIEQFNTRTAGMKKPSSLEGFVKKMGEYGKKLNDKLTELGEKAADYKTAASEKVFGKTDPDAVSNKVVS